MGIGSVPDAALSQLTNHQNLGIHTEMFSDPWWDGRWYRRNCVEIWWNKVNGAMFGCLSSDSRVNVLMCYSSHGLNSGYQFRCAGYLWSCLIDSRSALPKSCFSVGRGTMFTEIGQGWCAAPHWIWSYLTQQKWRDNYIQKVYTKQFFGPAKLTQNDGGFQPQKQRMSIWTPNCWDLLSKVDPSAKDPQKGQFFSQDSPSTTFSEKNFETISFFFGFTHKLCLFDNAMCFLFGKKGH